MHHRARESTHKLRTKIHRRLSHASSDFERPISKMRRSWRNNKRSKGLLERACRKIALTRERERGKLHHGLINVSSDGELLSFGSPLSQDQNHNLLVSEDELSNPLFTSDDSPSTRPRTFQELVSHVRPTAAYRHAVNKVDHAEIMIDLFVRICEGNTERRLGQDKERTLLFSRFREQKERVARVEEDNLHSYLAATKNGVARDHTLKLSRLSLDKFVDSCAERWTGFADEFISRAVEMDKRQKMELEATNSTIGFLGV